MILTSKVIGGGGACIEPNFGLVSIPGHVPVLSIHSGILERQTYKNSAN